MNPAYLPDFQSMVSGTILAESFHLPTPKPITELEVTDHWARGKQGAAGGAWPLRWEARAWVFVLLITCGQEARGSSHRNEDFSTLH